MIRRGAVRRSTNGHRNDEDEKEASMTMSVEVVADTVADSVEQQEEAVENGTGHHRSVHVDKQMYEGQLAKLQEQLEATLIEKLELQAQLRELEEDRSGKKQHQSQKKELEKLARENEELKERLKDLSATVMSNIVLQTQASIEKERSKDSGKRNSLVPPGKEGGPRGAEVSEKSISSLDSAGRGEFPRRGKRHRDDVQSGVSPSSGTEGGTSLMHVFRTAQISAWDWLCQFASDFSEDPPRSDGGGQEETPFSVKRLKSNMTRVGKAAKPLTDVITYVMNVLQFKNRAESVVVFMVYMYCVWNGWVIQLLLLLFILKLSLNYLYESHLAEQFGFYQDTPTEDTDAPDKTISDTLQIIKQVAHKVQTISGQVADALEKLTNLMHWHPANVTAQIYRTLWIIFASSLILPNGYVLSSLGVFLGFKLFIIDTVYRKYPKVKERYDSVTKMFRLLLTNEQLEAQCVASGDNTSADTAEGGQSSLSSNDSCTVTCYDGSPDFCTKFGLDVSEQPLVGWLSGKKCTLVDRERPLIGSKGGTLYLTRSCLCFESKSSEKVVIQLADIISANKSKAFSFLPGSGMAIEITHKTSDKSLMFGALLNRDQVLDDILEQGFMLELPWGFDPAPENDPTITISTEDQSGVNMT